MKRFRMLAAFSLAWLMPLMAFGSTLDPNAALNNVYRAEGTKLNLPQSEMTLTYTMGTPDKEAVYVYSAPSQKQGGFVIVAAGQDNSTHLLGYSDTETFDPDNIPPALRMLLDNYLVFAQNGGLNKTMANPASVRLPIDGRRSNTLSPTPLKSSWTSIAPLASTKWNQDAPYYNDCPLIDGQRCVTGCAATAMAQVVKCHEWPVTGTGTHSYQYKYNGTTYTESFDFANTTFDWANMLDSYTSSATTKQKDAVAKLMHACGVAADMSYSPDESGASQLDAARGLVENLGYDKGLSYQMANWYDPDTWEAMVYAQLAANQPVLYTGYTETNAGHAFVCDGYSSDGYFHINWGWGGLADGYFLLTDLTPSIQGIGGSIAGFTVDTGMITNIRKPVAGSEIEWLLEIYEGEFKFDKTSYSRTSSTYLTTPYFLSNTYTSGKFSIALELVSDDNTSQIVTLGTETIQPYAGVAYNVRATAFPVGEYDVYPVYHSETSSTWQRMKHDYTNTGGVHLTVTASTITVGDGSVEPDLTLDSELTGSSASDLVCKTGLSYTFDFDVTTNKAWSHQVYCVIYKDYSIYALSSPVTMNFTSAGTKNATWEISIPGTMTEGEYILALGYVDGSSYQLFGSGYYVTIETNEDAPSIEVLDIDFVGSESEGLTEADPAVLSATKPVITVTVKGTNGTFQDYVVMAFAEIDNASGSNTIVGLTDYQLISINKDAEKTLTFTGPWDGLETGKTYITAFYGATALQIGDVRYVRFEEPETVVEAESVTLNMSDVTLEIGQEAQLTATVAPDTTTDKTVTWTTDDTAVATVDPTGLVKAVGAGEAKIEARCGEASALCKVIVDKVNALESIEAADEHEATYYTITGLKVEPGKMVPGAYIRQNGKEAVKVIVK